MNLTRFVPALSIVVLILTTPVLFADEFKEMVEKVGPAFSEAARKGDAATMGSMYAVDAIAFPPNSEMISGREAIQNMWADVLKSGVTDIPLEIVSTESEGNMGVEVGKYTIVGAEKKVLDQGKYVVVWKKVDGVWKLYRDIWNSSMPVPAQAK